jgi:hypothetical protein
MRRITGAVVATAAAAAVTAGVIASTASASTGDHTSKASLSPASSVSAAGSASASGKTASTPTCAVSALKVTLDDGGVPPGTRSGMNHAGTYLRVKNTTARTCVLRGYPGLGLETAGHHAAKTDTEWGSTPYAKDPGKANVYLQPNDSAWADLAWTHSGSSAVDAKYLEVTPPASKPHKTIAFDQVVDNGTLNATALADTAPPVG